MPSAGWGGEHLVERMFDWVPGGEFGALLFMLLLMFVLGFFLEWIEISYIALPLFLPFFIQMGVDMVWLGILVGLVLQTSFLTPPFGWSLFFLKGVAPKEVTTLDIYKGALPFIGLQFFSRGASVYVPKHSHVATRCHWLVTTTNNKGLFNAPHPT